MGWSSRRVLVTGGAGFIGSHLVDRLIELGAEVTIADNLSKASVRNVFEVWRKHGLKFDPSSSRVVKADGGHSLIKVDLEEPQEAVSVVRGHDIVFHLAATIGGRGYIDTHPADCLRNLSLNNNVIDACNRTVERIHYASTACVYPVSLQAEYDSDYLLKEDDAFKNGWANCDREYGWAKFTGELTLWAYHKQYGLKSSVCRYVTAYGPRENDTHAIVALIRKAVDHQDPYVVWGSGEQDRDFTYVSDIVEGTILACEKITDGTPVNLGTSVRYKIKDVAHAILELTGHKASRIVFDTDKPEGVSSRALDISRAKSLLGWEPKVSLKQGLMKTIDWYLRARPLKVETLE